MTKETGGPAFPQFVLSNGGAYVEGGMSLRDYFAGLAMQATVNAWIINRTYPHDDLDVANNAYIIADAMLKAREK